MSAPVYIPDPDAPEDPAGTVTAGPFWPDIDLTAFRDTMRIGNSTITLARLRAAVEGALLTVDKDLTEWRQTQIAAGHTSLDAVPSEVFGDRRRLNMLFERAIYAYAAADLVETHRDITATAKAVDKSEAQEMTADDHRRNGVHAVRDIKGLRRIKVKLV